MQQTHAKETCGKIQNNKEVFGIFKGIVRGFFQFLEHIIGVYFCKIQVRAYLSELY